MQDLAFDRICYEITGKCQNPESKKIYYPQQLNFIFNRFYWENGQRFYMAQKYLKNKTGVIEGNLFYNPNDEKTDWVEELIILAEEERIAAEISSMEDALEDAFYDPEETDDFEGQKEDGKSGEEGKGTSNSLAAESEVFSKEYTGKNNQLFMVEYDSEIFVPQNSAGLYTTIEADGQKIKRSFYDSTYKLCKKETWEINNASDGKLLEEENYVYDLETGLVKEKTVLAGNVFTSVKYNEKELAESSKNYAVVERKAADDAKKSDSSKKSDGVDKSAKSEKSDAGKKSTKSEKVLTSVYDWKYTKDDQVQEQICKLYFYDDDYKKLEYTFEKKYIYKYNDFGEDAKDVPPDVEYFENGQLKMKTKYSAELGTYTQQLFFEEDFAVKTYYEKYKKTKEVYTQGKTVKRIKEYE